MHLCRYIHACMPSCVTLYCADFAPRPLSHLPRSDESRREVVRFALAGNTHSGRDGKGYVAAWHERRERSHGTRLPADSASIHCHAHASASVPTQLPVSDHALPAPQRKRQIHAPPLLTPANWARPAATMKLHQFARRRLRGGAAASARRSLSSRKHTVCARTGPREQRPRTHARQAATAAQHLPCTGSTPRPLAASRRAFVAHPLATGPPARPAASRPS